LCISGFSSLIICNFIPIVRIDEIFFDITTVSKDLSQATSLQWFSIGKVISARSLCQVDDTLGFDSEGRLMKRRSSSESLQAMIQNLPFRVQVIIQFRWPGVARGHFQNHVWLFGSLSLIRFSDWVLKIFNVLVFVSTFLWTFLMNNQQE